MLIRLQDFPEGEIIPVAHRYDPKKLEAESVDLLFPQAIEMEGTVEKGTDVVTFRGRLFGPSEMLCGRCLEKTASQLDKEFEFYYEIQGKDSIDTTDDIRESVILEQPLSYVCKETCRGLCPQCGINLNQKSCDCVKKSENSLSKLSDIWKKLSASGGSPSTASQSESGANLSKKKKGAK